MRDDRPTFLSLFTGVGGLDVALERAGFRCVGQVELDESCRRVLALRWPGVPKWGDVRSLRPRQQGAAGWTEEQAHRDGDSEAARGNAADGRAFTVGGVDLLVGGFPCQDFSVAGKRAGLDGYRGTLFWEIVRVAKELCPAWGLFENVPGLLSSRGGRDFWAVLEGLRECWPAVGWRVLDSRYFGVAQRRRRVFLVCGPDEARVASVLFEPEGGGGDSAAGREAGARVARSLAVGPGSSGYRYDPNGEEYVIAETLNSGGNAGGFRTEPGAHLVTAYQQHGSDVGRAGALRAGHGDVQSGVPFVIRDERGDRNADGKVLIDEADTLHAAKGPSEQQIVAHTLKAEGHDASEDGTGRGVPMVTFQNTGQGWWNESGTAQTVRAAGNGGSMEANIALASAMAVRRLTPTECERLQGFPDGWTCLDVPLEEWARDPEDAAERCRCPDSPRYRQMGNAVTVNVVEWIGMRLLVALGPRP